MIFGSVLCAMRFLKRDRFTARDLVFSPPPDLCLTSPPYPPFGVPLLKIKVGQLEKDNAALKAKLSELEKSLKAQEA